MARKKVKQREPYRKSGKKKSKGGNKTMTKTKNPWMLHLEKVRKKYPKKPLSEIMKIAKKSYKKK